MKQKTAGICLIFLAVLMGIFFVVREMQDQEKEGIQAEASSGQTVSGFAEGEPEETEMQGEEIAQGSADVPEEEGENEVKEPDEKEIPEETEGAGDPDVPERSEEEVIRDTEIKITDMHKDVRKEIMDYDAFVDAVKSYLFSGAVEHGEVISLNSVTKNYDRDNTVFLMSVETKGRNQEFYVIQNNSDGTYEVSE